MTVSEGRDRRLSTLSGHTSSIRQDGRF